VTQTWTLLGINAALAVVLMTVAAVPSFRTKDPSYVDGVWGLVFIALAVSSCVQAAAGGFGSGPRRALLVTLCVLWGARLSSYLFRRWRRHGRDPRYAAMLARRQGGSEAGYLLTRVFLTQAVVLFVVSLPDQLGQVHDDALRWWNVLGAVLALLGTAYEAVADCQLARFKADPAHRGQVMDQGLWRLSRHPNYFGEACTWWGLGLLAWSSAATAPALLGPAVLTLFLLKVSGVGLVEKGLHATKPGYADYVASTSAFLPLPKRSR
jgi:steroid 5-alpha reductase family enzyme